MTKQYDAILFDLDDTILDFYASEKHALDLLYHTHFGEHVDKDSFIDIFHRINRDLWAEVNLNLLEPGVLKIKRFEMLLEELKISHDIELIRLFYEDHLSSTIFWLEGAQEALVEMKNNFKMGIITNGLSYVQKRKYELMQGEDLFKCFLISEEVGVSKPHPHIFELAIESMGVSKDRVLMVGDSLESDYKGAQNAGIDFCWILPKGYNPKEDHPPFKVQSLQDLKRTLSFKSLA